MEFREQLPAFGKDFHIYDWDAVREELIAHPGQWGKLDRLDEKPHTRHGAQGVVGKIRQNQNRVLPASEFTASARNNQVWVKYIG